MNYAAFKRNDALGSSEYKYVRDDGSGLPDFNKLRQLVKDADEAEAAMEFLISFAKKKIDQQESMRRWYSSIEGSK